MGASSVQVCNVTRSAPSAKASSTARVSIHPPRPRPLQLHPMPRRLCSIATGGHVAPAARAVLRLVLKDAPATGIGTAADAYELAEDECISRALDDRNEEAREGIADRDERAYEAAVA